MLKLKVIVSDYHLWKVFLRANFANASTLTEVLEDFLRKLFFQWTLHPFKKDSRRIYIYRMQKKKLFLNHKELNIKNFKNYYLMIDVTTKMLTYPTLFIYYPIKIANDITWESVFYAITRLIWNLGNLRILKSNYLVKIVELEGRTDRKFLYRIRCWPNCRSPCISCLPQFLDPYYYPLTR